MEVGVRAIASNTTPADPVAITPIAAATHDILLGGWVSDFAGAAPSSYPTRMIEALARQNCSGDGMSLVTAYNRDAFGQEGSQSINGDGSMIGAILSCYGINNNTPFDVTPVGVNTAAATAASPATLDASIVTRTPGCLIVAIGGTDTTGADAAHEFATVAGQVRGPWAVHADLNSGFYNIAFASVVQPRPGLVTVRMTATWSGGNAGRAIALFALRPSAPNRRRRVLFVAGGGGGDIEAAGTISVSGSADLDAIGSLAATGTLSITGSADLDARGLLAAAGTASITGTADLDARGVLQAAGTASITGAADLDARGTLAAAGTLSITGAATLSGGLNDVTAAGTVSITGSASLNARGTLSAAGTLAISGAASLTEAGNPNMAAAGTLSITGAAGLNAHGRLTAAGTASITGTAADLDARGVLVALGLLSVTGSAALKASGQLSMAGQIAIFGSALLVDANAAVGYLVGTVRVRSALDATPRIRSALNGTPAVTLDS